MCVHMFVKDGGKERGGDGTGSCQSQGTRRVACSHPFSERERLRLIKSYSSRDEGQADPQLHTHTHIRTHTFISTLTLTPAPLPLRSAIKSQTQGQGEQILLNCLLLSVCSSHDSLADRGGTTEMMDGAAMERQFNRVDFIDQLLLGNLNFHVIHIIIKNLFLRYTSDKHNFVYMSLKVSDPRGHLP